MDLKVTVGCFENAFDTGSLFAIQLLMKHADDKVKGQLKESVPKAYPLLLNMYSNIQINAANSTRLNIFNECIRFMAD